ncbi:PLP-dependent aminotransferase family protein [Tsukamurella sp. 8F]|uniref:aminotransferase-like domain-containing protein n=1 Tax=unclassified Tsukamurella TaxID=2633480 RepID=UPI0023B9CE3A|nr:MULTISPECIES: PLP-dependent aminotransferase family protein [unclassified Tsukamurella]MDF0531901.1 PLP-dependent aminotransferase family protein [Tsukamurella sp. 8J]MDF0586959.1 PLP-dependent aminotransferase family protein [Tsukamurella sp. 8F]
MRPSPIREILAVIDRPDMVSFAGGLPATEALPDWTGRISRRTLQYGPSEGEPDLRATVSERLVRLGIDAPPERVMILSGSQQGIDLVAKLFIDPKTPVAVQSPTYLAALQVFRMYGARLVDFDLLPAPDARLAYIVPTFANPTGACLPSTERDAVARACLDAKTTLFEDDPYRELAYDACDRNPIAARMAGGSWVYQGSFSKTFAPGLRLGFLAASDDLFGRLVMLKQAVDLHSSRLSQRIVFDAITDPGWDARLSDLVAFYRARRDGFDEALSRHLASVADWQAPRGGLFFWLQLRDRIDTRELLTEAIERNVAFMPGEEFYPGRPTLGTIRLNFSHAGPDAAERGLRTLAELIRAVDCRR